MRAERSDAELLAAVVDPVRRRLIDVLLDRGEASVSVLSESVPVTRQAVSKHLAVLDRVGVVTQKHLGRETRYTLRIERIDAAATEMAHLAAAWDRRLQRIKRIAESLHRATKIGSELTTK
jgi:ArsR family transcriptional regulator, cadmium/lead-responsive transcriptional repressor